MSWRALVERLRGNAESAGDEWDPWSAVLAREGRRWRTARDAARGGRRVLIAPGAGGFHLGALVESLLAAGLTLRGAEVEVFLCDSALPACQMTEIATSPPETLREAPPQPRCAKCEKRGAGVFAPLGLPTQWLGATLTPEERAEAARVARAVSPERVAEFRWHDLAVGEHAVAGALRYFARGDFAEEPARDPILGNYLRAALLAALAMEKVLARGRFEVACFNHGIYVPQGIIGEVCRREGVRVVTWNPAYRKSSFIFSHEDSYHHTMISEPAAAWEGMSWDDRREKETLAYLQSRRAGTQDWIWFHDEPEEEATRISREVGVTFRRPAVTLLTNVMWDAQLHYRSKAFPNMLAWVLETIRYFARRPQLDLVIRVHPAELRGGVPSRQLLAAEIRRAFPELPANVFLVGPESQVSTYRLAELSNAVLIYNTKTGIEAASLGVPVVVAGEAWIRGKGFSHDATSPEDYRAILDRLPFDGKLSADRLRRARKYAYHFFFRRMIPLRPIEQRERGGKFALRLGSLAELKPGFECGLDVIAAGILEGTPFIYPAEALA
ncbi:MAG: capsular biosynthesis protein [Planctomycetes bacterium]|nr:capsular biosynthesis protein [Planctomycetota bacterium]